MRNPFIVHTVIYLVKRVIAFVSITFRGVILAGKWYELVYLSLAPFKKSISTYNL